MLLSLVKKVLQHTIKINHWKILLMAVIFMVFSSYALYFIEPKTFKNPFIGFWYVMTTVSQVGFGDYTPKTVGGRVYSIFMYLVGIGLFAIFVTKLVDFINKYEEFKEMGIIGFEGKDHVIMIHWSQKTKLTVEEMLDSHQGTPIVIIDQASTAPMNHKNVHYIQGKATKWDTLKKANALQAESICIFVPDDTTDDMATDGKTLLIASKVKQFAQQHDKDVKVIVEILDQDHITPATQQYFDEYILTYKPFSNLMAETAVNKT
ncbi:potassium channel family protein [Caldalkalibacillus salinus]|uniref:potassium channel family protein n=1 Tax=Caldalkalibacillus salinus TaxID=2803787 RepID=UPI001924FFAE|nr:potassium channel family protein [Caldalkalibacillus salinus]